MHCTEQALVSSALSYGTCLTVMPDASRHPSSLAADGTSCDVTVTSCWSQRSNLHEDSLRENLMSSTENEMHAGLRRACQ